MKKILFIDRDGTLIEEPADEQIDAFEKLKFTRGVFRNLSFIRSKLDFEFVMVSNQDGLGTESFPEDTFWPVHNFILQTLEGEGITFDEILIDPHFPEDNAPTRKPNTGLVQKYINNPEYDIAGSYVIGDRDTDRQFAENIGCKSLILGKDGMTWDKIAELLFAGERSWISAHYQERVANYRFDAVATHPKDSAEVYVMVIGETARSNNFSLYGYHRDTNPMLTTLVSDSSLIVFRDVRTESNTTHKSVPMLLTAASASDYSVLYREKGIIAAFKEAGFHTSFISNQLPNHSFIDFLGMEADSYLFIKEAERAKDNVSDMELLPIVKGILEKGRKKEFIVLHTYGSHFKYNERYSRNMAHFLPDDKSQAKYENRQQLVNAYDNTIRFTDYFLYKLSALLSASGRNSAWLYTSDHGENIYDDNRKKFLHASPNPSEYELRVPLLAWTSSSYRSAYPEIISALRSNIL